MKNYHEGRGLEQIDVNELGDKVTIFNKSYVYARTDLNKTLRHRVLKRDGYKCFICESSRKLEVHHFIPVIEGGSNNPENLMTLCLVCHNQLFHNKSKKNRIKGF
jgi:5-methylcytosine-specific restriction endonuclease McrA